MYSYISYFKINWRANKLFNLLNGQLSKTWSVRTTFKAPPGTAQKGLYYWSQGRQIVFVDPAESATRRSEGRRFLSKTVDVIYIVVDTREKAKTDFIFPVQHFAHDDPVGHVLPRAQVRIPAEQPGSAEACSADQCLEETRIRQIWSKKFEESCISWEQLLIPKRARLF